VTEGLFYAFDASFHSSWGRSDALFYTLVEIWHVLRECFEVMKSWVVMRDE
jgi:hypothetical protein